MTQATEWTTLSFNQMEENTGEMSGLCLCVEQKCILDTINLRCLIAVQVEVGSRRLYEPAVQGPDCSYRHNLGVFSN